MSYHPVTIVAALRGVHCLSENLKYEQQIRIPVSHRADLFGVPLEEIMGYDGEKGGIPRVVRDAIQFLRDTGETVASTLR